MSLYTPKSKYKKEDLFDITKVGPIRDIDFKLSRAIYDIFNQKTMKLIPNYLGLIPYEIYILPGMYLAIFQTLWLGTPNPVQFHLLPHWFAYSIFQLLPRALHLLGCTARSTSSYSASFQSIPPIMPMGSISGCSLTTVVSAVSLFHEFIRHRLPWIIDLFSVCPPSKL